MQCRVLIVDDSSVVRKVVRKTLSVCGVPDDLIREAAHGAAALDALANQPADVVLLDINMPVMDGEAFLRSLQSSPAHRPIVVIISTESNAERLSRLAALGAVGRLPKPFEPEALRSLVAPLLRSAA